MRRVAVLLLVAVACSSTDAPVTSRPSSPPSAATPTPPPAPPPAPLAIEGQPLTPRPVRAIEVPADPVIALDAADSATCAVHRSGVVSCWGADIGTPRRIADLADVASIALSSRMLCAKHRDGQVSCGSLPLRIAGAEARLDPKRLAGIADAATIAVDSDAVCALRTTGRVGCWVGAQPMRLEAVRGLDRVRALVVGPLAGPDWQFPGVSYACALIEGGQIKCLDLYRQESQSKDDPAPLDEYLAPPGRPRALHIGRPRLVADLSGTELVESAIGVCARSGTEPVRCAALDQHAKAKAPQVPTSEELARDRCIRSGTAITCALQSREPSTLTLDATDVAAGGAHACAIVGGGVACWGNNEHGELGTPPPATPNLTPAHGLTDAVDLVNWRFGVIAVRANGQLAYWGRGAGRHPGPTDIPITFSSITDAERVVAGRSHVCVLRRQGRVSCWGQETVPAIDHVDPTEVVELRGATELTATDAGVIAKIDGRLVHLGDPRLGRSAATTPTPIADTETATAIAIAGSWICVLDRAAAAATRGAIRCWAETASWTTEQVTFGAPDTVELAAAGPVVIERTPPRLVGADPGARFPIARIFLRRAGGDASEVLLEIVGGKPRATTTPLTTGALRLFASEHTGCAQTASTVICRSNETRFPPRSVPADLAAAQRFTLQRPACALRADRSVLCFDGDSYTLGVGGGESEPPVGVEFP